MSVLGETASHALSEHTADHSDVVLLDMDTAIEADFAGFWEREHRPSRYDTPENLAEEYADALEREKFFARKVYAAATEMGQRHPGIVTALFDVDETIAKLDLSVDEGNRTVIRPAFPVVVEALKQELGDRFEVGILTSRAQSHLDEELQSPTYLSSTIDKINPDFVISSRDGALADTFSDYVYDNHLTAREELGDFLDSDLVTENQFESLKKIQEVTGTRVHWYGKKLPILRQLVDSYPDRSFVYVDDASSASILNPNQQNIVGVQVHDNAAFWSI